MNAKLFSPFGTNGWSLHFVNISNDKYSNMNVWFWSELIGNQFKLKPILQGNTSEWIMVEFKNDNQKNILDACIKICEKLNIKLEL